MHSEWLWVAEGLWHVPFPRYQPAKWWKQQFGPGVRDIIKEKGCRQLLHLTGNCQLTLTKKGISALAAAFKASVIRWHYKYRIVHGGGGVGTSGSWTWQFRFSCAPIKPVWVYLKQNQLLIHLGFIHFINVLSCHCGCLYFKELAASHSSQLLLQEEWDDRQGQKHNLQRTKKR